MNKSSQFKIPAFFERLYWQTKGTPGGHNGEIEPSDAGCYNLSGNMRTCSCCEVP